MQELKGLLGVEGKYEDYRNFKKKILEVLKKEITKHTTISVEYKPLKKGRSVVGIRFEFWDTRARSSNSKQKSLIEPLVFDELTYSQLHAFNRLVLNPPLKVGLKDRLGTYCKF